MRLTDRLLSVKAVTIGEYLQALQVRRLVETQAVALATSRNQIKEALRIRADVKKLRDPKNPTYDFHWPVNDSLRSAISTVCSNVIIAEVIAGLRWITKLFEVQTFHRRLKPGCAEHPAILGAIIAGDASKASIAMLTHLDRVDAGVMDDTQFFLTMISQNERVNKRIRLGE